MCVVCVCGGGGGGGGGGVGFFFFFFFCVGGGGGLWGLSSGPHLAAYSFKNGQIKQKAFRPYNN